MTRFMSKATAMSAVLALVAAAAFLAKIKWGAGFYSGR